MLRVHFTSDDLARVRILKEPHPLWEVLLSLHQLQTKQGVVVFGDWRRCTRTMPRQPTGMLTALARPKGYSPDFLTPSLDAPDLDTALEALLRTGKRRLRTDIGLLAAETALPTWVRGIADGEVDAQAAAGGEHPPLPRVRAGTALARDPRRRHREPHPQGGARGDARARTHAAHPAPSHTLARLGAGGSLPGGPGPAPRRPGLTLVPSFFCWQKPITLADPDRPPVLVYPVSRSPDWAGGGHQTASPRPRSLGALLGRTRAAVLLAIAERPHLNTTELARRLGTSLASASQHVTVLREAGLTITNRHNGSAMHRLSDLGEDLLTGRPPRSPSARCPLTSGSH